MELAMSTYLSSNNLNLILMILPVNITAALIMLAATQAEQAVTDSIIIAEDVEITASVKESDVILRLTEEDFKQAAEELGVDVATIKAVNQHRGGSGTSRVSRSGTTACKF